MPRLTKISSILLGGSEMSKMQKLKKVIATSSAALVLGGTLALGGGVATAAPAEAATKTYGSWHFQNGQWCQNVFVEYNLFEQMFLMKPDRTAYCEPRPGYLVS